MHIHDTHTHIYIYIQVSYFANLYLPQLATEDVISLIYPLWVHEASLILKKKGVLQTSHRDSGSFHGVPKFGSFQKKISTKGEKYIGSKSATTKNRWTSHHFLLEIPSLKLTAISPLKIGRDPNRKGSSSNHPFSGAKMLVSERVNPFVPWSKVAIWGMVIPPLLGILFMGPCKPLRTWVEFPIPYYLERMGV